jgi:hypothetical protein
MASETRRRRCAGVGGNQHEIHHRFAQLTELTDFLVAEVERLVLFIAAARREKATRHGTVPSDLPRSCPAQACTCFVPDTRVLSVSGVLSD